MENDELTDWYFWKNLGICPDCQKRKSAPGRVRCWQCLQKNQEGDAKYYAKNKSEILEKRRAPEKMSRRRETEGRMRMRRKKKGVCTACGKSRATHGVLCERCWEKRRELLQADSKEGRNRKDHTLHHSLPVPEVAANVRPRNLKQIGRIIALYNAGWTEKEIAAETKVNPSTVNRYITKAKNMQKQQEMLAEASSR